MQHTCSISSFLSALLLVKKCVFIGSISNHTYTKLVCHCSCLLFQSVLKSIVHKLLIYLPKYLRDAHCNILNDPFKLDKHEVTVFKVLTLLLSLCLVMKYYFLLIMPTFA